MDWTATKTEYALADKISARAVSMSLEFGIEYKKSDAMMDVLACHLNGCPLKLHDLLIADDTDFAHDVFGIRRHINRRTGKLEDCFMPRYHD